MYSLRKRALGFLLAFFSPVILSAVFFAIYSVATPTEKMDEEIVSYASRLSNPLNYIKYYFGGMWEAFVLNFAKLKLFAAFQMAGIAATILWFWQPCKESAALMALAFLAMPPFSMAVCWLMLAIFA